MMPEASWVSQGEHRVTVAHLQGRFVWWVTRGNVVVDRSREPGRRHRRSAIRDARRVWPVES